METRRDFLKLLGVGAVAMTVPSVVLKELSPVIDMAGAELLEYTGLTLA